jgi:hypothetical protein
MAYQMQMDIDEIENSEYMKSCCVKNSFWENQVFKELREYNEENNMNFFTKGYRTLYLIRIYRREYDDYVFKIGSTENLEQRIKQHNSNPNYDCCGRIIIVAAATIYSLNDEMFVHNELANERVEDPRERELYNLNYDVYSRFMDLLDRLPENVVFKSFDYVLEDDGTELHYSDMFDEYSTEVDMEDGMVELDCNVNEDKYWTYLRKNH